MNILKNNNKISNIMNYFSKSKKEKVSKKEKKEIYNKAVKNNKDEK